MMYPLIYILIIICLLMFLLSIQCLPYLKIYKNVSLDGLCDLILLSLHLELIRMNIMLALIQLLFLFILA